MKEKRIKILVTVFLTILIVGISAESSAQSKDVNLHKLEEQIESDPVAFKYYKKSRRQRAAATTFGVISLTAIATGTILLATFESTGTSGDLGFVITVAGLYAIGSLTGITGLLFHNSSNKNKARTFSLYEERYGIGFIISNNQSDKYVIRANFNTNGVGIVLSL